MYMYVYPMQSHLCEVTASNKYESIRFPEGFCDVLQPHVHVAVQQNFFLKLVLSKKFMTVCP